MLALKLLLAPLLIALMSVVGQRYGHRAAGLLAGFPFVAGPIFIVFLVEQGPAFGESAGFAALHGVICLAVFCLVYAWLSRRHGWLFSLLCGWLGFIVSAAIVIQLPASPWLALIGAAAVPVLVPSFFPIIDTKVPHGALGWIELTTRMIAAALLVLALTGAAELTGPTIAGVLTPFPVASSVLAVFSHCKNGPLAVSESLRGVIGGLYSFVTFFAIAAWVLPHVGSAMAIAYGTVGAIVVQTLVFVISQRQSPTISLIARP